MENETTPAVFDRSKPVTINLKRSGKTVTARFPSDDELAKREKRMRTFYKKGSSLPEFDGLEEANLEMVQSICSAGDEIDENAANRIIEMLLRAESDRPERASDGYSVAITVLGGVQTTHVLREPTEREIRKYREGAMWMGDMKFGRQEAKTLLSAVGSFYDKLSVSVSGYSGGKESVPVTHKSAAVNAMLSQRREEQEEDEIDPGFQGPSGQSIPALGI